MKHKLTRQQAVHLTQLVTSMQPGWDNNDFLTQLADHREQENMGLFIAQIVEGALMGEPIDEALRTVQPHVCTAIVNDTAWLEGGPAAVVVNEDDPTKSVLLRKRKPEAEITRPPSEDPNHWRNRFAHLISEGKQKRESDLMALRATDAAAPQQQPSVARQALNEFADSFLPEGERAAHHDLPAPSVVESATAAPDTHQGVPTSSVVAPARRETALANQRNPEELESDHVKALRAAQRKREQEQTGYTGRNAGWNDHNPDK